MPILERKQLTLDAPGARFSAASRVSSEQTRRVKALLRPRRASGSTLYSGGPFATAPWLISLNFAVMAQRQFLQDGGGRGVWRTHAFALAESSCDGCAFARSSVACTLLREEAERTELRPAGGADPDLRESPS